MKITPQIELTALLSKWLRLGAIEVLLLPERGADPELFGVPLTSAEFDALTEEEHRRTTVRCLDCRLTPAILLLADADVWDYSEWRRGEWS
jgi:hypothetical protein